MTIAVIKRKATGFFKASDIPIVRQAVLDTTSIISRASFVVRGYYLSKINAEKKRRKQNIYKN
jgi:hypothetical protein